MEFQISRFIVEIRGSGFYVKRFEMDSVKVIVKACKNKVIWAFPILSGSIVKATSRLLHGSSKLRLNTGFQENVCRRFNTD